MGGNFFSNLTGLFKKKPVPAPPVPSNRPAPAAQKQTPKVDPHQNLILTLQDGIRRLHKCEATYAESLPMTLDSGGTIIWQGRVEVFNLKGHPKAKRCYAWMHPPGRPTQCKAVLEVPPIDSARKAVYSVILREVGSTSDCSTSSQFLEAVRVAVPKDRRG